MFPVQLFIIAAFALTFGMALGWAWGCAAMDDESEERNFAENAESRLVDHCRVCPSA
jgi:hypothetical protein